MLSRPMPGKARKEIPVSLLRKLTRSNGIPDDPSQHDVVRGIYKSISITEGCQETDFLVGAANSISSSVHAPMTSRGPSSRGRIRQAVDRDEMFP